MEKQQQQPGNGGVCPGRGEGKILVGLLTREEGKGKRRDRQEGGREEHMEGDFKRVSPTERYSAKI